MIKLIQSGDYKLVETKGNVKILVLENTNAFMWKNLECDGDLEYVKFNEDKICCYLTVGNFRLYEVKDETGLKDGSHFELYVGRSKWQGYILPKGLPTAVINRKPIKLTDEIITKVRKNKSGAI